MIELIEQFENETELPATWSNGGMGGYTKEYTEWLAEKVVKNNAVLPLVRDTVCYMTTCGYNKCLKCDSVERREKCSSLQTGR